MSQPAFDSETENYMFDVIKSGWWSQGKITKQFEKTQVGDRRRLLTYFVTHKLKNLTENLSEF